MSIQTAIKKLKIYNNTNSAKKKVLKIRNEAQKLDCQITIFNRNTQYCVVCDNLLRRQLLYFLSYIFNLFSSKENLSFNLLIVFACFWAYYIDWKDYIEINCLLIDIFYLHARAVNINEYVLILKLLSCWIIHT